MQTSYRKEPPKSSEHYFPLDVPDYRFDQRNEMFKRRVWDENIIPHANKLYHQVKFDERPGYRKVDYALRNAAWNIEYGYAFGTMKGNHGLYSWTHVPAKAQRFVETGPPVTGDPVHNSRMVKKAARFLGADLVGVCRAHPNLIYSHEMDLMEQEHRPITMPEGCDHTIVVAVEMDYELTRYSPDAISGAATGLGYSMQAVVANQLAAFIRGLGYKALPSGNDTALSIPLAIAAGLGELGRMGLLITEPYGPRVRLAKVFTDMPLAHDRPREFGVRQFCRTCMKCADHCPSRAISYDGPTTEGPTEANFSGIRKWYINADKCFLFWVKNWMDCNNCVMTCPFNKPPGRLHDFVRWTVRKAPWLNRALVWMDNWMGYGKPLRNKDFWTS